MQTNAIYLQECGELTGPVNVMPQLNSVSVTGYGAGASKEWVVGQGGCESASG